MTLNIVVCKIACVHDLCAVGNFMYNVGLCRALHYGNILTNNIEKSAHSDKLARLRYGDMLAIIIYIYIIYRVPRTSPFKCYQSVTYF